MKQYIHIVNIALAVLLSSACTKSEAWPDGEERGPQVTGLEVSLENIDAGETTRATAPPYCVNSKDDPTKTKMEDRAGWKIDVQIYKGDAGYTDGKATYTYNTSKWETSGLICFPNYTKQKIAAILYPDGWSTSALFIVDQSKTDKSDLLQQDILKEKDFTKQYNPAKTIQIEMKHMYSMLDFIVNDIEDSNIQDIQVSIGAVVYRPCKIKTSPVEYLLIVPLTTTDAKNPVVQITTKQDQIYKQEINLIGAKNGTSTIQNYTENTCYCFTLRGLELLLSPITVTDWATGQAVAGEYIAVTAYPTFRGKTNSTYYVYYDNCLKMEDGITPKMQKITFNSRGECTLKPDGRIITHIGNSETLDKAKPLTTPVLLSDMIVDLNGAILELTP